MYDEKYVFIGGSMKLTNSNITPNFTYREIACNDTDNSLILNDDIIAHTNRLQEFRTWYNRPMTVNSWYRTPAWNTQCGGASTSRHLTATATDIALPSEFYTYTDTRKEEFISNCRNKWHELCGGAGGFGIYNTFMHFDSRETKSDWDLRT